MRRDEMRNGVWMCVPVAAGLALSACVITDADYDPGPGSSSSRQATSAAESACMAAANSQYGGNAERVWVIRSEYSEANSLVTVGVVRGGNTERWRCLSSNAGDVADLSLE